MPKQTDAESRKTIAKITKILQGVSLRHRVDVKSMRTCDARFPHFVQARREFCILAHAAGAGSVTIAKILGCTPGTVRYHLSPELRAQKRSYYLTKRKGPQPCQLPHRRWNQTLSSEPSTITS